MRATKRVIVEMLACLSVLGMGALVLAQVHHNVESIEPKAGTWKTWLLRSGDQFRLSAPPDATASKTEVTELKTLAASRDAAALASIDFWSTGALNHRWNELTLEACFRHGLDSHRGGRVLALVNVAIYDALIAAWDSKYAYNRPRPSVLDLSLAAAVDYPPQSLLPL